MAITFVAAGAVNATGTTGTTSVTATPTTPAGIASGDRIYVIVGTNVATSTPPTPSNWTLVSSDSVGTGTEGAGAGPRRVTVFYRDYDGVWTLPSFSSATVTTPTIAAGAMAFRCGAGESFGTPTTTTGSDTTTATSFSVTGGTLSFTTNGMAIVGAVTSDLTTTSTVPTLTATGVTFGTSGERQDNGTASGNSVAIHNFTAQVTTGADAAPTYAATLAASSDGGAVFINQPLAVPTVTIQKQHILVDQARFRAANW